MSLPKYPNIPMRISYPAVNPNEDVPPKFKMDQTTESQTAHLLPLVVASDSSN